MSGTRWPEKKKYEAVALYKLLGSITMVANNLGVPYETVKHWHEQDWWKDYEIEVSQSDRAKLSGKLEKVREAAIKVVEDRLEKGDFIYNMKTGEIVRKPVNASVANKIMVDTIDKAVLIEKLNQDHKAAITTEKIADRLLNLQQFFMKGVRKPIVVEGEVIEVPDVAENEVEEECPKLPS